MRTTVHHDLDSCACALWWRRIHRRHCTTYHSPFAASPFDGSAIRDKSRILCTSAQNHLEFPRTAAVPYRCHRCHLQASMATLCALTLTLTPILSPHLLPLLFSTRSCSPLERPVHNNQGPVNADAITCLDLRPDSYRATSRWCAAACVRQQPVSHLVDCGLWIAIVYCVQCPVIR